MASIKLGQIIGTMAGNFLMNKFTSTAAKTSAAAAQLLEKSPLESGNAPTMHMEANKLKFTSIQFPRDLGNNEQGHYMIFYTISNKRSVQLDRRFNTAIGIKQIGKKYAYSGGAESQAEEENIGPSGYDIQTLRDATSQTGYTVIGQPPTNSVVGNKVHNTVTSAIALYMPPEIKTTYTAEQNVSELGLAGMVAKTIGGVASAEGTQQQIKAALLGSGAVALEAARRVLVGAGEALGGGDVSGAISKVTGSSVNPFQEVVFEKMNLREFSYTFTFMPRNKEEVQDVDKILKVFKYHMHPEMDSATGGLFMRVPSEFEIHYAYKDQVNQYLHKLARCVLKNCSVAYGDGDYNTFRQFDAKGAASNKITMTLEFQETEMLTKGKIMEGY